MSRLYLTAARDEIARRRGLAPKGQVVEAWPDHAEPGALWIGDETRALLDSLGEPIKVELALPSSIWISFAILCQRMASGPAGRQAWMSAPTASLKARVVSGHGIAVAWITLDRFGQRASYEPHSPSDPVFHLRRVGGGAGHLWRLFRAKDEAVAYMAEAYGRDSEGVEWAQSLAVADFAELLRLHAEQGER